MAYLVAARKYRPQTFADLVAQEHVAQTLANALAAGRLAHAYVFSGPRGVGKTTAARILAKAVNCETPLGERPAAEPCRTCGSCRDFEAGRSLNVFEMDAASNRGIDDIRELRETVRVPPQGAVRKVYVLDESHMFTKEAFNALLKTLEEPPPYVLFIFATTEPHKMPATILSRTQRFDFRRIAVPEIVGQLRAIAAAEGVVADEDALVLLARRGDGALRDALSLFDQARALCGQALTGAALREALGVVPDDLFFDVTDRIAGADRAGLLTLVDDLVGRGHALPEFVAGLAEHLRNLYVARSTGHAALIDGTDALRERYLDAVQAFAEPDLLHLLMLADDAAERLRQNRAPRLAVELALLQMASLARAADLDALVGQVARLERALASGATAPAATPAPSAPAPTVPRAAAEPPATYRAAPPPPSVPAPPAPSLSTAPSPSALPSASPPEARDDEGGEPAAPAPPVAPPPAAPSAPTPAPPAPPPAAPSSVPGLFPTPALRRPSTPRPTDESASGDGRPGPAAHLALGTPPADPHFGPELSRVTDAWPALVEAVRAAEGIRLASVLRGATPVRVVRGAVEVALADEFACRTAREDAASVARALADVLGGEAPPLVFVIRPDDTPAAETAVATDPFERLKHLRQEHPTVRALFERFAAEPVYE